MQEMLVRQRFQANDDVLFRQIANEAVLLHVPKGIYYSLNETSVLFWQAILDRQPLELVVDRVLSEYDTVREQVVQDLQLFLQDLLSYDLITKIED